MVPFGGRRSLSLLLPKSPHNVCMGLEELKNKLSLLSGRSRRVEGTFMMLKEKCSVVELPGDISMFEED